MAVQSTTFPKKKQIEKKFYLVNADGKTLGRLASRVAAILRGKNKPTFAPHWDLGDSVVIVNADKIVVLDEGRIVAEGKHTDLLRTSPVYREIYDSQLGGGFHE